VRQRQHLTADIQPIAVLNEDFKTKKVRFIPLTIRRGEEFDYPTYLALYHIAFPSNERHPDSWKPSRMRIIEQIGDFSKPVIT